MFKNILYVVLATFFITGCSPAMKKDMIVTIESVTPVKDSFVGGANGATMASIGGQLAGLLGAPIAGMAAAGLAADVGSHVVENATTQPSSIRIVYLRPGDRLPGIYKIQKASPEGLQLKHGDKAIFIAGAEGDLVLVPYHAPQ